MKKIVVILVLLLFFSPNLILAQKISVSTFSGDTIIGLFEKDNLLLFGFKCEPSCLQISGSSYKYGYMDKTGNLVIPVIYDIAYDFYEGLAIVGKCTDTGYSQWHITPKGERLYYKNYVDVHNFIGKYAIVDKDGCYHMCHINKKGEPLYTQTYQWLYNFNPRGEAIGIRNINLNKNICTWVILDIKGTESLIIKGEYNVDNPPKKIESIYY